MIDSSILNSIRKPCQMIGRTVGILIEGISIINGATKSDIASIMNVFAIAWTSSPSFFNFYSTMKSLVLQLRKLDIPFLDVRLPIEYAKSRLENSCNIPFSQVSTTRAFELPPRHVPFAVVHTSDQRTSVLQFFSSRHTPWSVVAFLCADLPNLSYHHSRLFTVNDFSDLTAASEETNAAKQDDPSSIFIPGTGKRYRRQKTESGVSASESAVSTAPSDTPGASEPCTGTCGATCDGTICMSLKQLDFIPLSTASAKPADMSQEEGQNLWDLCSAAGVPVKGEDTAAHSITLFHVRWDDAALSD